MMKAVLLESELYNGAMTDLTELKGLIQDVLIDNEEAFKMIEKILKAFDEAAAIAGQNTTEDGTRFEIVNADPETFMEIEYGDELES